MNIPLRLNEKGQLAQNFCTLLPAHGRDYKSAKAAKADFDANKDFVLAQTGQYINKEQIEPGVTISIRYKNQTAITPIKVK